MKKFFAIALVAMTAVFMASCGAGGSHSYKQGDEAPKIDSEKATVNGRHYNNDTERCWKVTASVKASAAGIQVGVNDQVTYTWCTEFVLVSSMENEMWAAAQAGGAVTASYSYVVTGDKDSEACLAHNDNEQ